MTTLKKDFTQRSSYTAMLQGYVSVNGESVPYWYSSRVSGDRWLLLLHGLGVDHTIWEPYLDELPVSYNILMLDLPGHGPNPQSFSLDDFALTIRDVLDTKNAASAVIVGHCIGGIAAQAFAAAYPQRCRELILIDTFPLGQEKYHYARFRWLNAVSPVMKVVPSPLFSVVLSGMFSGSKDGRKSLYPQMRRQKVSSVFGVLQGALQSLSGQELPEYSCPVHYIIGKKDHLMPIQHWNRKAAKLHNGSYTTLNQCGHYSISDDPSAVLRELIEYLN